MKVNPLVVVPSTGYLPLVALLILLIDSPIALLAQNASSKRVQAEELKPDTDQENAQKEEMLGPPFAFVCLNKNKMPDPKSVERAFKNWFDIPAKVDSKAESNNNDLSMAVTVGEHSAVIGLIPTPIPGDDIRYACSNSPFWPEAAKELNDHEAHLLVVVTGEFTEPYDRALFLSRAVAACTEVFPTAGVYWGASATVHSPAAFRKQVPEKIKRPEDIPALLWVGFLRDRHEDGSVSFYTRGLSDYGCMELEVIRSRHKPSEIFSLLHGTAQYLIYSGNVIRDGDTIGSAADEKIKTQYEASAIDRPGKVIRIEY